MEKKETATTEEDTLVVMSKDFCALAVRQLTWVFTFSNDKKYINLYMQSYSPLFSVLDTTNTHKGRTSQKH